MNRVQKELTIKRVVCVISIIVAAVFLGGADSSNSSDINKKLAQINIDTATLEEVIRVFGKPTKYIWGGETFTEEHLPLTYLAVYPDGFSICMSAGKISELRHEGPDGYLFHGKLQIGSSLEETIAVLGEPIEIVEGQPIEFKDGVLYKDANGSKGNCYYGRREQGMRIFFFDYKITALYVTRSDFETGGRSSTMTTTATTAQPIESVKQFDDVRGKDMRKLDLSNKKDIIATLTFNQKTTWPEPNKLPSDPDPNELMTHTMNPGLGVHTLHQQGITGKGVNVAIIDQPMYLDHPEFKGKVAAYYDIGCGSQSSKGSMHGPAVTSLLVGTRCGTAPDANVYYVAVPSWLQDSAYYANALDWIIQQNHSLPDSQKIRVVSVSAAPSGPDSLFKTNQQMWDQACARAEAQGILVLDCTKHHGLINRCWYDIRNPENVARCIPGVPGMPSDYLPGRILVPASPRTVAEEYDKGDCGYTYWGRSGLSWAIPYAAGVLALGWQIHPDLTSEQMIDMLFRSAYTYSKGDKVIDPARFIQLVKKAKTTSNPPSPTAF